MSVAPSAALVPARETIDPKHTWDLSAIFESWEAWEAGYQALDQGIETFKQFEGTLAQGGERLLAALRRAGRARSAGVPRLVFRLALLRPGSARQRRERPPPARAAAARALESGDVVVQSRAAADSARPPIRQWMDQSPDLALYRFSIEDLFRQQAHVLDEAGERLLSLSSRLAGVPHDAYAALSTADARFPTITLSSGESVQVSYGQYRKLLATCRDQGDRRKAYEALYDTYAGIAEYLRDALQRRDAARVVRSARARPRDDARSRAVRQQHPGQPSSRT